MGWSGMSSSSPTYSLKGKAPLKSLKWLFKLGVCCGMEMWSPKELKWVLNSLTHLERMSSRLLDISDSILNSFILLKIIYSFIVNQWIPLMRPASAISFAIMVTRCAWIAMRFVSSNRDTKYASDASYSAKTAADWNRRCVLYSRATSLTRRWNGNFLMSRSADLWNFLISLNATVPGL